MVKIYVFCNCFHARRVDSGEMTAFYGVRVPTPFDALVLGEPPQPAAQDFVTVN